MSTTPMPRYVCHKTVHALKINQIEPQLRSDLLVHLLPEDNRYPYIVVTDEWCRSHKVERPSGYYVQYEDGYTSWSPVEAFEKGYTPIAEGVPDIDSPSLLCGATFTPPRGKPDAICQLPAGHRGIHDASERVVLLKGAYDELVQLAALNDQRLDAVEERNIGVITQLRFANPRNRELTTALTNVSKTLQAVLAFADATLINSEPASFKSRGLNQPIIDKENELDAALQALHEQCGWLPPKEITTVEIREQAERLHSFGFANQSLASEMMYWRNLALVSTAMTAMIDLDMARLGI